MLALTAASEALGAKYLTDCTLYVTLEPCVMCAGALGWSQIGRIVYGASDEKRGFSRLGGDVLHPKTKVESGVLKEECENCRLQGEALREEAFVTRAARDAILETIAYMRAAILPAVLNGASAFLDKATGGKYVRFNADADYKLLVVDADGQTHAPETLSGGTAELCYIALRLGIAGRLYAEPCMPFFFDESFAHFDDLRKASAFMAISDLAAQNKGQFFILSCHKRDGALFEKICPIRRIAIG